MRVLWIEDDRMIGEGLSRGLAAEGYSVDWVRDGAAAENCTIHPDTTATVVLTAHYDGTSSRFAGWTDNFCKVDANNSGEFDSVAFTAATTPVTCEASTFTNEVTAVPLTVRVDPSLIRVPVVAALVTRD